MQLENLAEYLVPLIVLVLYFVLNFQKKKQKPPAPHHRQEEEERARRPRPAPLPKRVPPAVKTQSAKKEKQPFTASVKKGAPSRLKKTSRAAKLLKSRSLRSTFLAKEILGRPYD